HDAAEDVDQDAFDLVRRQDQLERLGHALLGGAATDVEEVGRLAARQLDHVHGGHGQAGAVDHAADVAVHGDVVEAVLLRLGLGRVFLGQVAHGGQVRVAELGVVVGVDLAVQRGQRTVFQHGQRVQLDQRQVLLVEQLVQAHHDLRQLAHLPGVQVHGEADIAALVGLQALDEIHLYGVDVLGRLARDLFDVHAAMLGGDERHRTAVTIDQHRQVQLAGDVGGIGDQHHVHRQRAAGRLVGLDVGAEHTLGGVADLVQRVAELHAAGLAAATGVDLRLDHPLFATQLLGNVDRCFGTGGHFARRYVHAVLGEQL